MASPNEEYWIKAKRIGRYIKGEPRLIQEFMFQKMPETIEAYADSDYAGCIKTRKKHQRGCKYIWQPLHKIMELDTSCHCAIKR